MFDNKKNPIVIEINPRQSGSIAISQELVLKLWGSIIKLYLAEKIKIRFKFHEKIIPYKSLASFKIKFLFLKFILVLVPLPDSNRDVLSDKDFKSLRLPIPPSGNY